MKYGTAQLEVLVVVKPQTDTTVATPFLTTVGVQIPTLDIVQGQSAMAAVTSRAGSIQMRLGPEKQQSHQFILVLWPNGATDSMPIQIAKSFEPICFNPFREHP
jgi:hypothetical protein